jgi:cell volume regulation protein A
VDEVTTFGTIVLIVSAGFSLAVVASKITEHIPVPAPALFLLAAAIASDLFEGLEGALSIQDVERIGTVALVLILFDGGIHVSWNRLRRVAAPVATLGVLGTFATAGVIAVAAHSLLGFEWITAWIIGAALAPTDPAVMFSVLGKREVAGRTGTILEGESGANDPVGIALMIGILEFATHGDGSELTIVRELVVEMGVGTIVGVGGAALLLWAMRRISLPSEGLYPLRTLAAAGVIYGAAAVLHGSGFLAVFIAGLLISDARAPYKAEVERFHVSLASLAEVAVFVGLGLTVDLGEVFSDNAWLDGLILALVLAFIARPLVVAVLMWPFKLRLPEQVFLAWGGLKGAVPILLAAFALLAEADEADHIYGIVFVVVTFSVLVQGSSLPWAAGRLGIRMRTVEPEPWDISIRLREEPGAVRRFVVARDSRATERLIRDLPLSERAWIVTVVRDGTAIRAAGSMRLAPGDEVLVLSEEPEGPLLRRLFEGRRAGEPEPSQPS